MQELTPGVERAVAAAMARSRRNGAEAARLPDYLLGLLDEEEGRPASLLASLGIDLTQVREDLESLPLAGTTVPLGELLDSAWRWSLAQRADPTILTDAFLMAVLQAEPNRWQTAPGINALFERLIEHFAAQESPFADPGDPAALFELPEAIHAPLSGHSPGNASAGNASAGDASAGNILQDLGAARILDANLNRSREALRVLEDYCRFVLDDRFLTEQVKESRHLLANAASQLPARMLLSGRETLRDVGTSVTARGEYYRGSPAEVAAINLKRLQESLRSLEEYGKLLSPEVGQACEAIRYRAYTLERATVRRGATDAILKEARLYVLLTRSKCKLPMETVIREATSGGAAVFQLREKDLPDRELLSLARDVRRWTRECGTLFIVNDRPDIARLAEADGVHLGQEDMPIKEARSIVGPDSLIGVSTHAIAQVRQAILDGADYLGAGPVFTSRTKAFQDFPGLDFVREACRETALPSFALGGIGPDSVSDVVAAGARRVAVCECICSTWNPREAAQALCAAWQSRTLSAREARELN